MYFVDILIYKHIITAIKLNGPQNLPCN